MTNDDKPMTPDEFHDKLNDPDHEPDNPVWAALRAITKLPLYAVRRALGKDDNDNGAD